jgi:hypothetical protein
MAKSYEFSVNLDIDFKLFRKQKLDLLKLQTEQENKVKAGQLDKDSRRARSYYYAIEGIIAILDSIQDQAVDNNGIPEKIVFPTLKFRRNHVK